MESSNICMYLPYCTGDGKEGKVCLYDIEKVNLKNASQDTTIINIYAPNIGAPQYVRQMLTSNKGEINNKMSNENGEITTDNTQI